MNTFVKTYIEQINEVVKELDNTLEAHEKRQQRAQADKEKTLKEQWALKRELNALSETLERFPDMQAENELLREKGRVSKAHAQRILDFAKALSEAAKP